jgi:hypothetical protein
MTPESQRQGGLFGELAGLTIGAVLGAWAGLRRGKAVHPDGVVYDAHIESASTATCPHCGHKVPLGNLVVGADRVYVSCLAKAGALFDQLVGYANDLGLIAEEIDTANGGQLGNFRQAFSHIGLITAAWEIDKARGDGE